MIWEDVLAKFKELFGDEGEIGVYFAPGRVNMIGEHTDYNGGHVFPCALTIGTYGVARKRDDKKLRFYSMNFEQLGVIESSVEGLKPEKEADWTNYPKGVMWAFGEKGMKVEQGMDLVLFGNIPNGSGLSSSASVEVLTGYILKDMFGFDVTNQDLALIGQFSENKFNNATMLKWFVFMQRFYNIHCEITISLSIPCSSIVITALAQRILAHSFLEIKVS